MTIKTIETVIVCDRCGKHKEMLEYIDNRTGETKTRPIGDNWDSHSVQFKNVGIHKVSFCRDGEVCDDCFKAFCELAEAFFDESNKLE